MISPPPAWPSSGRETVFFADFELDPEGQQLRKAGVLVRLQPQPFRVLLVLASRAGQVVSRDELRREVWGEETFVDFEQGLNFCIRQIRVVLGDEVESPRYIETVPRRGYRFIASVNKEKMTASSGAGGWSTRSWSPGRKLGLRAALGIVAVTLIALAVLRYFQRPPLTTKDSLLVAEFANNTGDPVFDGTLKKAVSVDLGQSPYLNVVSDENIREALAFMGKPPDARVTVEIGREICRRNGIKALLSGSISALGNQYFLTLEALDAHSGDLLAQENAQADGKEQVIGALSKSSARLRKKLGETLASIQQFDKPLELVTTPSLEALQLFTLGLEKRSRGEDLPSVPFFQRAIQLDPNFALAYAHLGVAYSNIEQWTLAEEYEKKAFALSDRVSERERLYITAHYYNTIGQKDTEIQTYELYSQLYQQDALPQNNLSFNYDVLGQYDKAVEHGSIGLGLAPNSASMYSQVAHGYAGLGRLEEAKAIVQQGLKRSPDTWLLHLDLSNIALAPADNATRERADAALKETPEGALNLLYRDAALAASHGRMREAEELYAQAKRMALKLDLKDNAAYAVALQAVCEAYLGHAALARTTARTALNMSPMFDVIESSSWALALAGDDQQAASRIHALANRRPDDTMVHAVWVPGIEGLSAVHRGKTEHAIEILGSAAPYDRAMLDSRLLRAKAYLEAKRPNEAIKEFLSILALRARFPYDPACSLAELGLARSYFLVGDKTRSLATYKGFLALWQDADPDIPILKHARAEYTKLQ